MRHQRNLRAWNNRPVGRCEARLQVHKADCCLGSPGHHKSGWNEPCGQEVLNTTKGHQSPGGCGWAWVKVHQGLKVSCVEFKLFIYLSLTQRDHVYVSKERTKNKSTYQYLGYLNHNDFQEFLSFLKVSADFCLKGIDESLFYHFTLLLRKAIRLVQESCRSYWFLWRIYLIMAENNSQASPALDKLLPFKLL